MATEHRDPDPAQLHRRRLGRRRRPSETLEDRDPATGELAALVPLSGAADVDAAVARRARGAARVARDRAAEARPRGDGAARGALGAPARRSRSSSPPTWARRSTTPAARSCAGSSRPRRPAAIPHLLKGENLEGVAERRRRRARAPAGRRRRRDHPVQLPGDDPALVPALRDRLRQHASSSSRPSATRARRS